MVFNVNRLKDTNRLTKFHTFSSWVWNMWGAVFVYGYPFRIFAIYITAQMGTLVDDQTFLAMLLGHTGKCSPEQACTNYQEIVFVLHTALFIR